MVLENFVNELAWLAATLGTLIALSILPQIYKTIKRKSVEDISLAMFVMLFLGMLSWLLYGLGIDNFPLIITGMAETAGTGTMILLYFKYNKREAK